MHRSQWMNFPKIRELYEQAPFETVADKVDSILSAAMEAIADALPTATAPVLRDGALAAKDALEAFERSDLVDEHSPSYAAGRLASAVDVLGYASYQTADDAILTVASRQPYSRILGALQRKALRNIDLVEIMGMDKARISKRLGELRALGAVTSHKQGRDVFNALTPVGRLVVEKGWQDERRAPLHTSNVVSLEANRFDLASRRAPADVAAARLPRISASGG